MKNDAELESFVEVLDRVITRVVNFMLQKMVKYAHKIFPYLGKICYKNSLKERNIPKYSLTIWVSFCRLEGVEHEYTYK